MIAFMSRGFNLTHPPKPTSPELANAALFYGLYSAVGRRLKVTPQHVRHVALGIKTSKRVKAAIDREIGRRKASIREKAA
jgi:hypothetical protein